ncbi:MAG: serine/threonine protein kinase [Deltaproteobacteria bacterium]|nr:serine/threonine protein kinase [Deltaproteobacteria bacterium]MBW2532413.1 serine/threonine protein kinase [Deltaproteobacteria bacterium]
MSPERWERVCELFGEATALPAERRALLLADACGDDEALLREVYELLDCAARAETVGFLEVPPWVLEDVPLALPDFGDYERIDYLGHGGMGVVYKAYHRELDCWVALKMALPHLSASDDATRRFRAEAQSMAKVLHPNIIHVHEVGEIDGRPYFRMDLIEGPRLTPTSFQGDPRAAVELVEKVAGAVHHAHRRGLLHRDLKPDNILLDDEGRPHVGDFGLARRLDEPHRPREVVGTLGYMSPEQADPEGDETVHSDVYGLGAILYALLTGRTPPERPTHFESPVDRDLAAVCLKALSRRPRERHGSARDFATDLRRWLAGKETSAHRWSSLERIRGWCRRHPVVAWLGALTAVLLALSTFFVVTALVSVAREPALAQQALARQQADTMGIRLRQLAQAVESAAAISDLGSLLRAGDHEGLQQRVEAIGDGRTDLSGKSPFETWFLLTLEGRIVAHWPDPAPDDQRRIDFRSRDYFQGALRRAREDRPERAYISRVYFGYTDARHKFGVARAVFADREPAGVLVASVTTSPALGLPVGEGRASHTALIARVDPSRISPHTPHGVDHVLLIHPAYDRGTVPVTLTGFRTPSDGVDERYRDPGAAIAPSFGGTWLAGFAQIEDTEFVVVSQRRYRATASLMQWGAGGAVAVALLVILWRLSRRRRLRTS